MYIIFLSGVPLCNCDAPPFGFLVYTILLIQKKKQIQQIHPKIPKTNKRVNLAPNFQKTSPPRKGQKYQIHRKIQNNPMHQQTRLPAPYSTPMEETHAAKTPPKQL
jgi:hypothetical protein